MTTEGVYRLFCDIDLRQHVVDTAKALTHNRLWQKELVGAAWFRLGEADDQKTGEYYRRYAELVMRKRWLLLFYGEIVIT